PFEDSENTRPEDGPPIAAPEQILHHAGCGKCRDDEEAWNRSRGCVVRNERHGHDGEQGEPDAEMELETLRLGIGRRPFDAWRSLTPCKARPRPSSVVPQPGARDPGPSTTWLEGWPSR